MSRDVDSWWLISESGNERDNLNSNLILLLSLFQFLVLLIVHFLPSIHFSLLPSRHCILTSTVFPCFSRICTPLHFHFYLTPLSSCLPSLRELSNNRSLDNLDCIGGTGSSLPPWDDDDFSQACSTLGRRSCMAQVSTCTGQTGIAVNVEFVSFQGPDNECECLCLFFSL